MYTKIMGLALCFAGGALASHADTFFPGIGLIFAGLACGLSQGERA